MKPQMLRFTLTLLICFSISLTARAQIVNISDPDIWLTVTEIVGKPPGAAVTVADMQSIAELEVTGFEIVNLTGLEHAINMTLLDLTHNLITNLLPLRGLTNLEALGLGDNRITSISHLSGLHNLTELYLWGNSIVNISALRGLTNLELLNLGTNSIVNISPLQGLNRLEVLILGINSITNLSPLRGLTNLEALGLGDNLITNISDLSGLHNLTELYLWENTIVNISALRGLTNLKILNLRDNNIADISALRGLTNLTEVNLINNNIADISPLVANTGLGLGDEINLEGNPLNYLSRQIHVPALRSKGVVVTVDAPATNYAEDVNNDGDVDIIDLILVAANYGRRGQSDADVNGDGVVNIADLIAVANILNAAAAPAGQPQNRGPITPNDVEGWLAVAEGIDLTDPRLQKGVRFLKQLHTSLLPKETILLSNYPNPFNPETWIPYALAQDADVTLTIYDTNGEQIRRFDLGHQRAGHYTDRNRAVYFDGRNNAGEPVSSGVYFYHLSAGDYSATRKLVILK